MRNATGNHFPIFPKNSQKITDNKEWESVEGHGIKKIIIAIAGKMTTESAWCYKNDVLVAEASDL